MCNNKICHSTIDQTYSGAVSEKIIRRIISSAGLRVLMAAQIQMNEQGSMTVIHANEDLMEIFEITGFTEILTIK